MNGPKSPTPDGTKQPAEPQRQGPLSLSRLREAFAAMLGEGGARSEEPGARSGPAQDRGARLPHSTTACEISPRSVAEAMLFVGRPDNGPISARELAASMRGVSPQEIEAAVDQLNATYEADGAPYWIEHSAGGYRMALRPEFGRMRDKFYGKAKEARLSPAALEVLAVLAYNQPASADELNNLRGAPSGAALATLVRRKLVSIERPADGGAAQYCTTDRFLQLFGLASLSELPRSEELSTA